VAGEHRAQADSRAQEAEMAEQRAREAELEAKRERAEAELHQQRAQRHERGMADDELIDDHERDRFEGTSATRGTDTRDNDSAPQAAGTRDRDAGEPMQRESMAGPGSASDDTARTDYEQGRIDERRGRFDRSSADEETDARRSSLS